MLLETYKLLADTISCQSPFMPVHCRYNTPIVPNSIPLNREAMFFDYVIVGSKRFYASRSVGTRSSSFVEVAIPSTTVGSTPTLVYGEILEIIQFNQDIHHANESMWFVHMRWLKKWSGERDKIWDMLYAPFFIQ